MLKDVPHCVPQPARGHYRHRHARLLCHHMRPQDKHSSVIQFCEDNHSVDPNAADVVRTRDQGDVIVYGIVQGLYHIRRHSFHRFDLVLCSLKLTAAPGYRKTHSSPSEPGTPLCEHQTFDPQHSHASVSSPSPVLGSSSGVGDGSDVGVSPGGVGSSVSQFCSSSQSRLLVGSAVGS